MCCVVVSSQQTGVTCHYFVLAVLEYRSSRVYCSIKTNKKHKKLTDAFLIPESS